MFALLFALGLAVQDACDRVQICVVVHDRTHLGSAFLLSTSEAALVGLLRRAHAGGFKGVRVTTETKFAQTVANTTNATTLSGYCRGAGLIVFASSSNYTGIVQDPSLWPMRIPSVVLSLHPWVKMGLVSSIKTASESTSISLTLEGQKHHAGNSIAVYQKPEAVKQMYNSAYQHRRQQFTTHVADLQSRRLVRVLACADATSCTGSAVAFTYDEKADGDGDEMIFARRVGFSLDHEKLHMLSKEG